MMRRIVAILAILTATWPGVASANAFGADTAAYQLAQSSLSTTGGAKSPNCPYGMDKGDGCPEAPTTAGYRIPNCWVGNGLRQSGQTWDPALGEHPPSWNVPGCDYPVGATTSAAEMLANPATYDPLYQDTPGHYPNVPPSCRVIDPNDPKNVGVQIAAPMIIRATYYGWVRNEQMPMLYCGTQDFKGLSNLYLGAYPSRHKAVGIFIERSSSANIEFQNLILSGDQDVLWSSQIMSGNAIQNISFKHSSFNGNFFDPSGCCQSGSANWMELWNKSGTISFDYVNISEFQGYEVTLNTGRTIPGGKGSISITHSVLNGCLWRQAAGHGECFTGGPGGWNHFDLRYNLIMWYGGNGGHTTFFHLNSTNYNSPYDNVEIEHNLYISNTNGNPPPKILYHLEDAGPAYNHAAMLVLDGAAVRGGNLRPGQCLQQGMAVQGTALNLWKLIGGTGCDARNTKFLVDCAGGENFNYPMCPSVSVSGAGNTYDPSTGKLTLNFPYAPLGVEPPPVPQGVFHPSTFYRGFSGVSGCRGAPYAYATATTGTDQGIITWTAVAIGPPGDLVNIIVRPASATPSIAVAGSRITIAPRIGAVAANDVVRAVAAYAPAAALVRGAVGGDGSGAAYVGSVTLNKGTAGDVLNQNGARLVSYNNSGYTSITVQLPANLGGFTGIEDNSCALSHDSGVFSSAVPYASAASPAVSTHMSARNSNAFHDFIYVPSDIVNIHDNFVDDSGTPTIWLTFAACNVVNMRGNQFLNTHSTTVTADYLGGSEDYPGCTANIPGVGFRMPPDGAQWGGGYARAPNTLYCTGIPVTNTQNWEGVTVSVRGNWRGVLFQQAFYLGGTDATSPTALKPVGPPLGYSHSASVNGFSAADGRASLYSWLWNKNVSGQSGLPMAVTAGQTIFHCVEANGTMNFTAFANPGLKYELSNPYGTWPNLTDVAMPVAGVHVNVPPIIQAPSFP
jgi:hypothetical protein